MEDLLTIIVVLVVVATIVLVAIVTVKKNSGRTTSGTRVETTDRVETGSTSRTRSNSFGTSNNTSAAVPVWGAPGPDSDAAETVPLGISPTAASARTASESEHETDSDASGSEHETDSDASGSGASSAVRGRGAPGTDSDAAETVPLGISPPAASARTAGTKDTMNNTAPPDNIIHKLLVASDSDDVIISNIQNRSSIIATDVLKFVMYEVFFNNEIRNLMEYNKSHSNLIPQNISLILDDSINNYVRNLKETNQVTRVIYLLDKEVAPSAPSTDIIIIMEFHVLNIFKKLLDKKYISKDVFKEEIEDVCKRITSSITSSSARRDDPITLYIIMYICAFINIDFDQKESVHTLLMEHINNISSHHDDDNFGDWVDADTPPPPHCNLFSTGHSIAMLASMYRETIRYFNGYFGESHDMPSQQAERLIIDVGPPKGDIAP